MTRRTVLIADEDTAAADVLAAHVEALGLRPVRAKAAREVIALVKHGVDCMFIDIKSPAMKAPTLLPELRRHAAQIPIAVCTTDGTKQDVVFAMRHGCVDWLDKPIDEAAVTNALRRIARETRRAQTEAADKAGGSPTRGLIKEIVEKIRDGNIALPEMPKVVDELRVVLADLTVETDRVIKVLEKDPSLAARMIATANTVAYGGRGRITDLRSAVTRLGNRTIDNLVQTAALQGMFTFRSPAFKQVFRDMWKAQFMSACLCRDVAIGCEVGDPDEMYLLGLMHNIGELFLLRVFGELFQRHSNQVLSMNDVLGVIREWHNVFGEGLMKKWDMGDTFMTIARRHHEMDAYRGGDVDPQVVRLMHVVNLGDQLTEIAGVTYYPKSLPGPSIQDSYDAIGCPIDKRDAFRIRAEEMRDELKDG
ncbi:MAG: HDOD domain-containing protein [bacterium]|nr:HDOD domain-containing protein [Myxococcales bacterium]MCB9551217.1 HDOD domain-containing protein [Myxococcales bacterium]